MFKKLLVLKDIKKCFINAGKGFETLEPLQDGPFKAGSDSSNSQFSALIIANSVTGTD